MRREVYDPRRSPPKRVPKPDALAVLAEANKDSVDPSLFYDSEEKKRKDREEAEERQRKTEFLSCMFQVCKCTDILKLIMPYFIALSSKFCCLLCME